MVEIEETTVGDILSRWGGSIKTGPFGTALKAAEYSASGVPLISVGEIGYGTIHVHSKTPRVDAAVLERLPEYVLQEGDIVFARKGAVDRTAMITRAETGWFLGSDGIRLRLSSKVCSRFIGYWLRMEATRSWLLQHAGGTTMASLNQGMISRIPVGLPALIEQQRISACLGALDDKIKLNHRLNETIEAMARAIFKDWFVDFGPTRAKMEGRAQYYAPHIWRLFPDRLDQEGRPEGWALGRLGEFVEQRIERVKPSHETVQQPYVPIDCISSNCLSLGESKPGANAQSSLTKFYKDDFLFGAMRPYFHKVCIAPFEGTTRTTAFVLKPKVQSDFSFACLSLHDPDTIDYATRHSTGSTIPYAVWNNSLEDMPTIVPPRETRAAFEELVRPLLARLPATHFENASLAATRDLLLPKLMSGEIRVKDAERTAEMAA